MKTINLLTSFSAKTFWVDTLVREKIAEYRVSKEQKTLDAILRQYTRLIVSIAKKYKHHTIDEGDLVHTALEGVIEAINIYYDVAAEEKFITYIKPIIEQRMSDCLDLHRGAVYLPKNIMASQGKLKGTGNIHNELLYSKINIANIQSFKLIYDNVNMPLAQNIEEKMVHESLQFDIFRILDVVLSFSERDVIIQSFGLDGSAEKTLKSISSILGVTPQRVGDLRSSALVKMKSDPKCIELLMKYLGN